jgi:hypothetical protein
VVPAAGDYSADQVTDNVFGFRNRIINPSGQIWQRLNTGAAAITDVTYDFDRWYGITQSNGVTSSQLTNVENSTPFMMRMSQANASAQRMGRCQVIESANIIDVRGRTVTLSARVRMSSSTNIRYAIGEWTSTADGPTKDVVNDWTSGTYTTGNFFISSGTTVTAVSSTALTANTLASITLTGTVSASMNNLWVCFWTESTAAQNVTMDVGKVQLEIGSAATPLAVRSAQEELALSQRYYQKTFPQSVAPAQNVGNAVGAFITNYAYANGAGCIGPWSFTVVMRVNPTVTTYNPYAANSSWRDTSNTHDASYGASGSSDRGLIALAFGSTQSGFNYAIHAVANSEL